MVHWCIGDFQEAGRIGAELRPRMLISENKNYPRWAKDSVLAFCYRSYRKSVGDILVFRLS